MQDLEGKTAIITGAARWTGEAIARRLAAFGARVILGDIRPEEGRAAAAAIGSGATFMELDVTRADDWARLVERALALTDGIDILVNNAAVLHLGPIDRTPEATFRRVFEVNTVGAFLGIAAVAPVMRSAGRGSIVNVASLDALIGMNGLSAYCSSKWALRGLSHATAMELGRDGIRVNTVCPAGGNPAMYEPWMSDLIQMAEQTAAYVADRALPAEAPLSSIADAVCFLASDMSSHCTGIDLPVDGGASAGRFIEGFNRL